MKYVVLRQIIVALPALVGLASLFVIHPFAEEGFASRGVRFAGVAVLVAELSVLAALFAGNLGYFTLHEGVAVLLMFLAGFAGVVYPIFLYVKDMSHWLAATTYIGGYLLLGFVEFSLLAFYW